MASSERLEAIDRRRQKALESRLMRGDTLKLQGPTHRPNTLPSVDYPVYISASTTPPRPPHQLLLGNEGPAKSSSPWNLHLVEPLQVGANEEGEWSQVWRAEARAARTDDYPGNWKIQVVLKLYDEAFFPNPEGEDIPEEDQWSRYTPEQLAENEARVYSRARSLQGRDICICYGFYMFSVRDNEQVLGVILEDLASTADDLGVYQVLMKKRGENTAEMVESIALSAFGVLGRLHDCNVVSLVPTRFEAFVLREYEPKQHCLVFVGFGRSQSREILEEVLKKFESDRIAPLSQSRQDRYWVHIDHYEMVFTLGAIFDAEFDVWWDREKKENSLDLMAIL